MDIAMTGKWNTLRVEADYQKGGYSMLSGESSARGLYVSVRPMSVGNGMSEFELFAKGSFKLLIKVMERKSQKQIESLEAALNGLDKQQLLSLWQAGQYTEMVQIIKDALPQSLKAA